MRYFSYIRKFLSLSLLVSAVVLSVSANSPVRERWQGPSLPIGLTGHSSLNGGDETTFSPSHQRTDDQVLEVGKLVERELRSGEPHSYGIVLRSGQYVHIVIGWHDVEAETVLFGPDSKELITIVDTDNSRKAQNVSAVAETDGKYRLEVRLRDNKTTKGLYTIRIAELRGATTEERNLIALQEAKRRDDEFGKLYGSLKYDEALTAAQRSLIIRERILNPNNRDIAVSLNELALAYYAKREFAKAEPLANRAVTINEKSNADSTALAASLNTLALIHHAQRNFGQAKLLYERVLSLTEKSLGPGNPAIAETLDLLALLYSQQGAYAEAAQLYERALAIREKSFGLDSPAIVETLNNLAERYRLLGRFEAAEPLYKRALTISEKAFGADDPRVAAILSSFASFYYMKGDLPRADRLFQRALEIREKKLSADDPLLAESINDLTYLRIQMGNYVDAEKNYVRALEIVKKAYGPEHQIVATALNNLAELYRATGQWDKAEPLYQESLAMREKVLGPEHPQVAESLNNFSNFYQRKGKYAQAESLQIRALAIDEKRLGPEHPDVAMDLNNLALIYYLEGQPAKALPLSQRALTIRERIFGREHPLIAESLISISLFYNAMGDVKQAFQFLERGLETREAAIALTISIGSAQQKALFMESLSHEVDGAISFQIRSANNSPEARMLALTTVLRRKGRALDAAADETSTIRRHLKPEDRRLSEQLAGARSQLATLVFEQSGQDNPVAYQEGVARLRNEIERIESQLAAHSVEYRRISQPLTVTRVQEVIPGGAVLVEFISYQLFDAAAKNDKERFGVPRYAAYILRKDGEPGFVDLGEAAPINQNITRLRAALRNPKDPVTVSQLARMVDESVMRPVRKAISGTRLVFLSLDGQLSLIPFAALMDERNKYLIEQYTFSYLTSGRDLLRLQTHVPTIEPSVVIANPLFNRQMSSDTSNTDEQQDSQRTGQPYFKPLIGTQREGEEIGKILNVKPLTNEAATETALKRVRGPRILHLATHGFFLPNADQDGQQSRNTDQFRSFSLALASAAGDNPLLRSGIALSGANNLNGGGGENGVLTALEAAGLDLLGTKLVVLSACETGLGSVQNGEGVYGLRRALTLAGAESQVLSLWKVDDEVTRDLMIAYYKRLMMGEGRAEALRQVQLLVLKSKNSNVDLSHPFYWAAFIGAGEWKALD